MRIRSKIRLVFTLFTVLVVLALGVLSIYLLTTNVEDEVQANIRNVAQLSKEIVQLSFEDRSRELAIGVRALQDRVAGTLTVDGEAAPFQQEVRHQSTGAATTVEMPVVLFDGEPVLERSPSFSDAYSEVLGGDEVTIFLVHEIGLVRYDTSIEDDDGISAQWSYIPTGDQRFVELVENQEADFLGTAQIVGETYLTDYQRFGSNFVLFVGVRQVDLDILREKLNSIRIGETGYPYVMDGEGNVIIHPEIEGRNISDLPHIQEMLRERSGRITYTQATGSNAGRVKSGFFDHIPELDWIIVVAPFMDEFFGNVRLLRLIIGGAVVIAALLTFFFATIIGRRISMPIERIADTSGSMAAGEGDLTVTIEAESRDETRDLAENFNAFVGKILEIVRNIKDTAIETASLKESLLTAGNEASVATNQISSNVESIRKTSERLQASSKSAREAVERITGTIDSFRDQVNQQVSAVEESTSAVDQMAASIQNIARISEKRSDEAEELRSAAGRGSSVLEEMRGQIAAFSKRLDEINEASELIQGVAGQTNMLAMNAAIEAAHAGEAGRGFSVVSEEIRKLAEQTSERSQSIDDTVKRFSEELKGIEKTTAELRGAFDNVSVKVESSAEAFGEIGATTKEMSVGSEEIVRAMELLRNASSTVDDGSRQIESESGAIRDQMGEVDQGAHSMAGALNEVSLGLSEINGAVEELRNSIVSLGEKIDEMAEGVNQFKTEA